MRALFLFVAVAACDTGAKPAPPPPPPTAEPPAPKLTVHMKRTRCYGSCPAYEVTIASDGSVRFVGEEFVTVDQATGHISRDQLRALSQLIDAAHFFELHDRYVDAGCKSVWTDSPTTTIDITRDGRKKSIERYHGCEGAPLELDELANSIDLIAGTAPWVGPRHD